VGQTPDADGLELRADGHEQASESQPHSAAAADDDEHQVLSEASPHVGQTPDASMDELELGVDDRQVDERRLVSEASPHVGQAPDAEAGELALGADEHQLESESQPGTSADVVELRAHEASEPPADIGQPEHEASNAQNAEFSSNLHGDEVELSGEEELTSDEDDTEGDNADKSTDPDDSSAN
jgi:hypothetical protein